MAIGPECKCGARTLDKHSEKVAAGYSGHVYSGFFWGPNHPDWYDQAPAEDR